MRLRRPGRVAVAGLVAALVLGVLQATVTFVRLQVASAQLQRLHAAEAADEHRLALDETRLRGVLAAWSTERQTLATVTTALDDDGQRLLDDGRTLGPESADLTTLQRCVGGVQQAVKALGTGTRQAAIDAIGGVTSSCESLVGGTPGGPVYPFDFPDPDVLLAQGTYFAYGTNAAGGNVQIIRSTDLVHWSTVGDALPGLPAWATPGTTWAPSVVAWGGRYLLYYTTAARDDGTHCISVAVADTPTGPFVDNSTVPVVCQRSLGGSIDPAQFLDAAGNPWLVWKSNGGSGQPATIWSAPLEGSGMALVPGVTPSALLRPTLPWEGTVVEGPFMWPANGTFYLFYSGNDWNSASYAEGVAVCQGPSGPCTKPTGSPILSSQSGMAGPGGASVFADAQGAPWIVFHAWLPGAVGYPHPRLLFLRRLDLSGTVPVVESPG